MNDTFKTMLAEGGKKNSLGRAEEVVQVVLGDKNRLEELYSCLFLEDAWVRMRAADALEKVCRSQPEWLESYIDRFFIDLAENTQPSIQWHIAQIFGEVILTPRQQQRALAWLTERLQTLNVDWIVAANSMDTLMKFVEKGQYPKDQFRVLLVLQQSHHSKSVVRRATKLLEML